MPNPKQVTWGNQTPIGQRLLIHDTLPPTKPLFGPTEAEKLGNMPTKTHTHTLEMCFGSDARTNRCHPRVIAPANSTGSAVGAVGGVKATLEAQFGAQDWATWRVPMLPENSSIVGTNVLKHE